MTLSRLGAHLYLTDNATGEKITIDYQYYSPVDHWGVEQIQFADGTSWDLATITSKAWIRGGAGNEVLYGSAQNDTFQGNGGADYLQGGAGSDTYVWKQGDGNDEINDQSGSTTEVDVLKLEDLNASDVTLSRLGAHLYLTDNATGEKITIDYQYYSPVDHWGVEQIQFADGTSWDLATITSKAWIRGGAGNESLYGSAQNDTFQGNGGADYLQGGAGSDTYVWKQGDGNDNIDDQSGSTTEVDVLKLEDLNASDVTLGRLGSHLSIKANSTGETITVDYQFYSQTDNWGTEQIQFADGTSWDLATINSKAWIRGGAGDDVLNGTSWNDTIQGNGGSDYMTGGAGSNSFVFTPAFGQDTIADFSSNEKLQVDHSVFAEWMSLLGAAQQVGADTIITADPANTITLKNVVMSDLTQNQVEFV